MTNLVASPHQQIARTAINHGVIPQIVAGAGERASRRFLEFFAATIRNPNTRAAYLARASERDGVLS